MNRRILVVVCGVVSLLALGSIWFTFRTKTVQIPHQEILGTQKGLGQVLGEETAKITPARGHVVIFAPAPLAQLKQYRNYVWAGFEGELQRHDIDFTVESAFNAWNTGAQHADQAAFFAFLERHASANALVFLVDLPDWTNVAESFPKSSVPKMIAIDNLRQRVKPRYSGYFENGVLVALISAYNQPAAGAVAQPKTPREWFDKFYQVYTPQNYQTLPE